MPTTDELRKVLDTIETGEVSLTYRPGSGEGGDEGAVLRDLARRLAALTGGRIPVAEERGPTPFGGPCLSIGENIHYLAPPEGLELPPFIDALSRRRGGPKRDEEWPTSELLVFVAAGCPRCPQAARSALTLARRHRAVTCIIADAQRTPALAGRYNVRSVPFTLLDRTLSWTGVVTPEAIARRIADRETPAHRREALRSMVESGRLQRAADAALADPESFTQLWRESTTALRIGLMMVAQELLERAPNALDAVVAALGDATTSRDAALRGDTADLLGQIGHPAGRPFIEGLLGDPNPDVAEIAGESLAALK